MNQTNKSAFVIIAGHVFVMICMIIAASGRFINETMAANGTLTPKAWIYLPYISIQETTIPSPVLSIPLIVNATDDIDDGSCDSTHCSLREAILASNEWKGPDNIIFDPSVFPPSETVMIELASMLPGITDGNTTIDASGARVTVDGNKLSGDNTHGFIIQSSNNTLKGILIQNVPAVAVVVGAWKGLSWLPSNEVHNNTLDSITVINSGYGGPPFTGRADAIWIYASAGTRACRNRVINCTVENNADDGIEIWSQEGGVVDDNFVVGNIVRGNAEVGIEIDVHGPGGSACRNIVADNIVKANIEGGIHFTSQGGGTVDGNIIDHNIVVENISGVAIGIGGWDPGSSASRNRIANNIVEANIGSGGITMGSYGEGTLDGNTIINNTVVENMGWGIAILAGDPGSSASANLVINNTVEHSGDAGIVVTPDSSAVGDGNCVYYNNFIENNYDPIDTGNRTCWDYSGKGNYWSDYQGVDNDGNGIGDDPYYIPPNGVDNYPVMEPIPTIVESIPVTVTPVCLNPPSFSPGDTNVVLEKITLQLSPTDTSLVTYWLGIRLDKIGSGSDSDVSQVEIWRDDDDNGELNSDVDTEIGSGIFNQSTVNIMFPLFESITNIPQNYFIAIDVSENISKKGNTIGIKCADSSYFSVISPATVLNNNFPFQSYETPLHVVEEQIDIPNTFSLSQNYPNPFNIVTIIKYQIPHTSHVLIRIYNLNGQIVNTLIDKNQSSGYYSLTWNGKNRYNNSLASGVYFYKMVAGNFVKVYKLLLVR